MPKVPTQTVSAEAFQVSPSIYKFPFVLFGEQSGRTEWRLELRRGRKQQGRYYITSLLLWTNSPDEQYKEKIFEIPCTTEALCGSSTGEQGVFSNLVWLTYYCSEHGSIVLCAYAPDGTDTLEIDIRSGVGIDVVFKTA